MKINAEMYYKPRDIAKYKMITSSRGGISYNFVLNEIKEGRLKAENRGRGETPYYWVKGEDLIAYQKEHNLFMPDDETDETDTNDSGR